MNLEYLALAVSFVFGTLKFISSLNIFSVKIVGPIETIFPTTFKTKEQLTHNDLLLMMRFRFNIWFDNIFYLTCLVYQVYYLLGLVWN